MKDANYFIEKLDMTAHPEGGYYKEKGRVQHTSFSHCHFKNGGPDGTRTRDLRRDRPAF